MADTIFALASGRPPCAIAIVRVSGPAARDTALALSGREPQPQRFRRASLRGVDGTVLDDALLLFWPAEASPTGEDVVELHLHGSRAVIAAVEAELARLPGLRPAAAGEFTRRALVNGRLDLLEAEALGDLLAAETEQQRRHALGRFGGAASRRIGEWRERLLRLAAEVEALIDYEEEGDVQLRGAAALDRKIGKLAADLASGLGEPPLERLRNGVTVVIAGPANAGKSSVFNRLIGRDAAIVTAVAGTTRDVLEADLDLEGTPVRLIDTAGLRASQDEVERIGVARARDAVRQADLLLWMGPAEDGPDHPNLLQLAPKADLGIRGPGVPVSSIGEPGLAQLKPALAEQARALLPREPDQGFNARQVQLLRSATEELELAAGEVDPLILAERLRRARLAFDRLTGRAGVEEMLDQLFARFCVGK